MIERCLSTEHPGWLALREALWPSSSRQEHLAEMTSFLAEPERFVQLVATSSNGEPVGLAEAALRSDYVNGTSASPVAFLEGLFVSPEYRRQGIASQLVAEVALWGSEHGCQELASDTPLGKELSQVVHKALGFHETERVVFFSKAIP